MSLDRVFKIGEIYNIYFDAENTEENGWRPGIVFQNNVGNLRSPNIIALPLTSSIKKMEMPTHVLIPAHGTGLKMDSVVICENPKCVSKKNIGQYITTLPKKYMKEVAIAHLIATSAISFVDIPSLMKARETAIHLNQTGTEKEGVFHV